MARTRPPSAAEARELLLVAAQQYVNVRRTAVVFVADAGAEIIRSAPAAAPPEGVSEYDAAILAALTDTPMSSAASAGPRRRPQLQFVLPGAVEPTCGGGPGAPDPPGLQPAGGRIIPHRPAGQATITPT